MSATGLSVVFVLPSQFTAWGFERPQLRVRHRQTHLSTAGRSVKHARSVTRPPGPRKPHTNENAPQGRKPARYEVWSYFCTFDEFCCTFDGFCSKTLTLQQNSSKLSTSFAQMELPPAVRHTASATRTPGPCQVAARAPRAVTWAPGP